MRKSTTLLAAAALTAATPAAAQEAGTISIFGVSATFSYDDNWRLSDSPDGDSYQALTELTYSIRSSTRTQSLGFELGVGLAATKIGDASGVTDVSNPRARADYRREGGGQSVSALVSVEQENRDIDHTTDSGVATIASADLAYTFGQDAPFSGGVALGIKGTGYNADAGEDDDRRVSARTNFRFDLTPATAMTASGSVSRYTVDDVAETETDSSSASLGLSLRLNGSDTASAGVSRDRIESSTGASVEEVNWSLGYSHAGPVVTTSARLATETSFQGNRTSLSLGQARSIEDATLSYGIGVTRGALDDDTVTANLDWRQTFDATSYMVGFSRGVSSDDEGNETTSTDLDATVRHELTPLLSLNGTVRYGEEDDTGGEKTSDGSLSASVGMTLGEDWELSVGYTRRFSVDAADVRTESNTIFATIAKTWVSSR